MKLEKGIYLVIDHTDRWPRKRKWTELLVYDPKYHHATAPYIQAAHVATTANFDAVMRGESLRTAKVRVPARKVPAQFHTSHSSFPLNWVRIPDEVNQQVLRDFDLRIKALQEERKKYIEEHYLEWDIAELSDFEPSSG